MSLADWTTGHEAIAYQRCNVCGHFWYFARNFCPHCGASDVIAQRSAGRGTIHAASLVHRAPSPEWRQLAPYLIVLVDIEEGFRMMAHGEKDLQIGDLAEATFVAMAGRMLPFFQRPKM